MFRTSIPRWIVQSAIGLGLAVALNVAFNVAAAPLPQAQKTGVSANGGCEPGYTGSAEKGCTDVNECAVSNGGCHRMTLCENTPGSRTCGGCPKDYAGDGYVGCFDVNECASPDCSDRLPSGATD